MASTNETTHALVLHQRPFRESSQILSLFTERDGRIDVTVRASRALKTKTMAKPLPFAMLQVAWAGRGQLPYLAYCEEGERVTLTGSRLYCGMYLNELLYHLLPKHMAESGLFTHYWQSLCWLQTESGDVESCLRQFEWQLLACLGYGLSLSHDASGRLLQPEMTYSYLPDIGLVMGEHGAVSGSGASFLSLADGQFDRTHSDMPLAKRLMRYLINLQLGGKALMSRQLFQ